MKLNLKDRQVLDRIIESCGVEKVIKYIKAQKVSKEKGKQVECYFRPKGTVELDPQTLDRVCREGLRFRKEIEKRIEKTVCKGVIR